MDTLYNIAAAALALFAAAGGAAAQEAYKTETLREDIKSLEVKVEGELLSDPCIELGGDRKIEVRFDALHRSSGRFAYKIVHCDADWKESALMPVEYMKGFRNATIEDFANSINTETHYANYRLLLPNEDMQMAVSGNYAVVVYEEDAPDKIALTACFSVVEPLVDIDASISGNTDIDYNKGSQQISFTLTEKGVSVTYPQTDLKIYVFQNGDWRTARTGLQPLSIMNRQLRYEHNRDLIFKAGNEYRRIEFLTHRYNGMGVDGIKFYNPYYHATLLQDKPRANATYLYDQDQNGRFFVNCSGCEDPDTEADYYIVHFSLLSDKREDGGFYIYGDMFNNILDERSRMEYNAETGAYEKAVMLKQGLYNYLYAFAAEDGGEPSFLEAEGDFYETENEYTIAVYYRPMGGRYDRLVGFATVSGEHASL